MQSHAIYPYENAEVCSEIDVKLNALKLVHERRIVSLCESVRSLSRSIFNDDVRMALLENPATWSLADLQATSIIDRGLVNEREHFIEQLSDDLVLAEYKASKTREKLLELLKRNQELEICLLNYRKDRRQETLLNEISQLRGEYQSALQNTAIHASNLEHENSKLRDSMRVSSSENEMLKLQLESANSDNHSMRKQLLEAKSETEDLKRQLLKFENDLRKYAQHMEEAEKKNSDMHSLNLRNTELAQEISEELAKSQVNTDTLSSLLKESDSEKNKLEQELNQLQVEFEKISNELMQSKSQVNDLTIIINQTECSIQSTKQKLNQSDARIIELEQILNQRHVNQQKIISVQAAEAIFRATEFDEDIDARFGHEMQRDKISMYSSASAGPTVTELADYLMESATNIFKLKGLLQNETLQCFEAQQQLEYEQRENESYKKQLDEQGCKLSESEGELLELNDIVQKLEQVGKQTLTVLQERNKEFTDLQARSFKTDSQIRCIREQIKSSLKQMQDMAKEIIEHVQDKEAAFLQDVDTLKKCLHIFAERRRVAVSMQGYSMDVSYSKQKFMGIEAKFYAALDTIREGSQKEQVEMQEKYEVMKRNYLQCSTEQHVRLSCSEENLAYLRAEMSRLKIMQEHHI